MKTLNILSVAALLSVIVTGAASAATFTKATVKKIDEKACLVAEILGGDRSLSKINQHPLKIYHTNQSQETNSVDHSTKAWGN